MNQLAKITKKPTPGPALPELVLSLCPFLCESEWLLSRDPAESLRLFSRLRFMRVQLREQFSRDMSSWSEGQEVLLQPAPRRDIQCVEHTSIFLEVLQPRVLWNFM